MERVWTFWSDVSWETKLQVQVWRSGPLLRVIAVTVAVTARAPDLITWPTLYIPHQSNQVCNCSATDGAGGHTASVRAGPVQTPQRGAALNHNSAIGRPSSRQNLPDFSKLYNYQTEADVRRLNPQLSERSRL